MSHNHDGPFTVVTIKDYGACIQRAISYKTSWGSKLSFDYSLLQSVSTREPPIMGRRNGRNSLFVTCKRNANSRNNQSRKESLTSRVEETLSFSSWIWRLEPTVRIFRKRAFGLRVSQATLFYATSEFLKKLAIREKKIVHALQK